MSGFVAIINTDGSPVDSDLLGRLTSSLRFRGPDALKMWSGGQVAMGHTLFKTTDEAAYEDQPSSLEGRVWITGMIRIDARSELINDLGLNRKIKLDQTPDSSLVLHAYRKWGDKCLDHLMGDFAFVLWDKTKQKIICARDHFGMRQLYYARLGTTFLFSNSLYCLLQHPAISKKLDDRAIGGFLLFGNHSWFDKKLTAYTDIESLLPAHVLTLENGHSVVKRYWDIPCDISILRYKKESEYIEHFQEVFKKAVYDRLRTERIVLSMSGGMDSSAIAATLYDIQNEVGKKFTPKAITVIYKKVNPCQEHYYADLIARKLNLPIEYVVGDEYPLLSGTLPTTRPLEIEQPLLWLDMLRKERMSGRVVLTGAAGDNLLSYPAGLLALLEHNPYKSPLHILRLRNLYGKIPGFGTGLFNKLCGWRDKNSGTPAEPYPYPVWLNKEFEMKMGLKEWWSDSWAYRKQTTMFRSRDFLLHQSLVKPDWCFDDIVMTSDFVLPEQRDPYLDKRVVEFVLSLPALPWMFNKHILRKAMESKLPVEVIKRPKTPLGSLQHSLLDLPGTEWVDEWKALHVLEQYVNRMKIPELARGRCGPAGSYVNIRPLLLQRWLECVTDI